MASKMPAFMAKKAPPFEKSGKDKEKGMREGGKKDMAVDKKQAKGKFPAFLKK